MRLMEKYNNLIGNDKSDGKPGFVNLIDTGNFTMVSGHGSMLKDFIENNKVEIFSGQDAKLSYPNDANCWSSKHRFVPFDDTFTFLPQDVTKRKLIKQNCYNL